MKRARLKEEIFLFEVLKRRLEAYCRTELCAACFFAGLVLGELISPEDEGIMFLGNVCELLHDCMSQKTAHLQNKIYSRSLAVPEMK
jgi:hypothetical protein